MLKQLIDGTVGRELPQPKRPVALFERASRVTGIPLVEEAEADALEKAPD